MMIFKSLMFMAIFCFTSQISYAGLIQDLTALQALVTNDLDDDGELSPSTTEALEQLRGDGIIENITMTFDGLVRDYDIFVPPYVKNHPNESYPLLIGLHGGGSSSLQFISTAHLLTNAITNKYIVLCPNGIHHGFNGGGDLDQQTDYRDDVGFISSAMDKTILNYPVDPTRIYTLGHSNGGFMSYRLGAELPDRIAAVGANASTMLFTGELIAPVPIIHMHGKKDDTVPYTGGELGGVTLPPLYGILEQWAENNGMDPIPDPNPATENLVYDTGVDEDNDGKDDLLISKTTWISQDGIHDVVLYMFEKDGHSWRNSDEGMAATPVFWDFFLQHCTDYAGPVVPARKNITAIINLLL